MFNQVLRPIVRNVARNGIRSSSSKVVDIKLPTINDIPVPKGPWQEYYDKRQKVYNTQLALGTAVLLGTIIFVKESGIIFFNYGPPEEPTEK
ncbi:PREDICTED: uncharacterized protein LOC106745822 [Dinoponera quadriceps]|uniref:Uncharacterized protein LOC106745822 n=1 Tax=Dinoponera quadriceps TaxID=609295 RepID=A0A6P3XG81_DINQU|nr:PREDICTED: uncharacterized protein LOC106745822 [Dinoponera quadriceps]